MRFLVHKEGDHKNMCLLYDDSATVPQTLGDLIPRYVRYAFDPRRTSQVYFSSGGTNYRYAVVVPARYKEVPTTYRAIFASGFPYKTYDSAQDMIADQQDIDTTSIALVAGLPSGSNAVKGAIRLASVFGRGTGTSPTYSFAPNHWIQMYRISAETSSGASFHYVLPTKAGIPASQGIQHQWTDVTANGGSDGMITFNMPAGNMWTNGQTPVPKSELSPDQLTQEPPFWSISYTSSSLEAAPSTQITRLRALVIDPDTDLFEEFAITRVTTTYAPVIKVARPKNDPYYVFM